MSDSETPNPAGDRKRRRKRRRRVVLFTLLLTYLIFVMFGGCADFLLLHPTKDPIDTTGATRRMIDVPGGSQLEVFTTSPKLSPATQPAVSKVEQPSAYLLIVDGNAGRAETAVFWGDVATGFRPVEVWAVNYPGFGGSPGKAKLSSLAPATLAAFDAIAAQANGKPIIIWGASIGTAPALYVAAHRPVAGLILTNPPPLRQLIMQHYGWWNLWLAAIPVSLSVPADLNSIANGAVAKCPALFISAADDEIVPASYHRKVFDAYAGPKQIVSVPGAGHNTPANQAAPQAWQQGIDWLWKQVGM
jgi:pimeloyl-ACP methyl ester carboxylesterase